jgi:hypothetical protein
MLAHFARLAVQQMLEYWLYALGVVRMPVRDEDLLQVAVARIQLLLQQLDVVNDLVGGTRSVD